jgi:hypothetical protein
MARATATVMADGNATETAAAMVLDNRKSIWPAATAMGGGDGNGDGVCNGDGDGDGNCNGDSHGKSNNDKGRVASSCASNVQHCGRGDTLPPPSWTQRKVHSPALRHGGDTAKSVSSLSRGRVPDSSPWILFLFTIYNNCSAYWTTLSSPPALFRRSRTLLAHWCSTSSTPPRTLPAYWWSIPAPIALFVKVSPGRAWNDYNLNFLCWCEMTNLSATFFISQTFALLLTDNTFVIWKHPVVRVETFKVKVLLFSLLNNPLFAPPIIQALKNPVSPLTLYLLHFSKNLVSLLMIYPGSYCTFSQGKPRQGLKWL